MKSNNSEVPNYQHIGADVDKKPNSQYNIKSCH